MVSVLQLRSSPLGNIRRTGRVGTTVIGGWGGSDHVAVLAPDGGRSALWGLHYSPHIPSHSPRATPPLMSFSPEVHIDQRQAATGGGRCSDPGSGSRPSLARRNASSTSTARAQPAGSLSRKSRHSKLLLNGQNTQALRGTSWGIVLLLQVGHAVGPVHLQVEQGEPALGPGVADEAVLDLRDPPRLVVGQPEILDDLDALGHPLPGLQADDLAADDPLADVDLVLGGALPPEHAAGLAGTWPT